jgi:hypothetical protein
MDKTILYRMRLRLYYFNSEDIIIQEDFVFTLNIDSAHARAFSITISGVTLFNHGFSNLKRVNRTCYTRVRCYSKSLLWHYESNYLHFLKNITSQLVQSTKTMHSSEIFIFILLPLKYEYHPR